VEPSEAAMLHDAVSRLARGETATRICRAWNAAGAQTSRGAKWRPQTLRRTLLSNHLTGARGYPRLLSDEEAAVARSALTSEQRRPGRPSGRRAPLVGFVYCGECGARMTTGGGAYRCSVSHGGCGGTSVKMELLNEYVVIQAARQWKPRARQRPPETTETRALIEELRRLEIRSEEIADGLAHGTLTVGIAGEATRRVDQRRRELTEQLSHALPAPRTRSTIQPGDWRQRSPPGKPCARRRRRGPRRALTSSRPRRRLSAGAARPRVRCLPRETRVEMRGIHPPI
jgi:Recombinase/Recombinase zinc beta ribbon domain